MSNMNNERKLGGVLEYLYAGGCIKVNGEDCYLCESENGELDLGVKKVSLNTQTNETKIVYLRLHISLGAFVRLVENMSEEEWVAIAANNTLRKVATR